MSSDYIGGHLVNSLALHFAKFRPELLSEEIQRDLKIKEQEDTGDIISKGVTEIERIKEEQEKELNYASS